VNEMTTNELLDWRGPVLVVPGLGGSGERHWQSLWQRRYTDFRRVQQSDWHTPDLDRWARSIVEAALQLDEPALVIAHSFGCLATVRAEIFQSGLIAGALLVAPADPARFNAEAKLQTLLQFPTSMIASRNDPWIALSSARRWAARWGSDFIDLGEAGHINADSGFGEWPSGLDHLDWLCRRVNRYALQVSHGNLASHSLTATAV
jgi:predicted alpha/beta hydrolase family esterase